jgi:hypothetical protein
MGPEAIVDHEDLTRRLADGRRLWERSRRPAPPRIPFMPGAV